MAPQPINLIVDFIIRLTHASQPAAECGCDGLFKDFHGPENSTQSPFDQSTLSPSDHCMQKRVMVEEELEEDEVELLEEL